MNAQQVYTELLKTNQGSLRFQDDGSYIHRPRTGSQVDTKANAGTTVGVLDNYDRDYTTEDGWKLDVAMWYGAIVAPGDTRKAEFIKRIFITLRYGGLMYNRGGQWRPWSDTGVPVACALSHGGRILIQTPRKKSDRQKGTSFVRWLLGDVPSETRPFATHGLSIQKTADNLGYGRSLQITESQGQGTAFAEWLDSSITHYGINPALGGVGNRNPYSGNTIHDDGAHGHIYVYNWPATSKRVGGVMIGVENSGAGKTGQSGKAHGPSGSSVGYSAVGGHKWEEGFCNLGPGRKLNSMAIDLSGGWSYLKTKTFDVAAVALPVHSDVYYMMNVKPQVVQAQNRAKYDDWHAKQLIEHDW